MPFVLGVGIMVLAVLTAIARCLSLLYVTANVRKRSNVRSSATILPIIRHSAQTDI